MLSLVTTGFLQEGRESIKSIKRQSESKSIKRKMREKREREESETEKERIKGEENNLTC